MPSARTDIQRGSILMTANMTEPSPKERKKKPTYTSGGFSSLLLFYVSSICFQVTLRV